MWELTGIAVVALIFTATTAWALWKRQFTYRFGPTIRRAERPVEYWAITLLFLACTGLLWTIFVFVATGLLERWQE